MHPAPYYQTDNGTLYHGNALDVLKGLPDESVNCCVTSPPYWGLRDYGVDGQLGLEKTPEEYVAKVVEIFREVRRVLRADGVCFLNLGDCYATGAGRAFSPGGGKQGETYRAMGAQVPDSKNPGSGIPVYQPNRMPIPGLKPKDLIGIPWRVAFALQQPYYSGKIKDEAERIWLAAMIDGEGCMFIHKRKAGQSNGQGYTRKNDTYSAGLEVANVHLSIIEKCQQITGIGSICRVERETKLKKRNIPLYRWNVRSNQCRDIVREVYPYLVGKQHEARILLRCPSSGEDAEKSHASLIALHNGKEPCIDFKEPGSMWELGWHLRQDVIWNKKNPMPESVKDRCTKAHEYIFMLTKSGRYWYDAEAVREPDLGTDHPRHILSGQPALEPTNGLLPVHSGLRRLEGRNGLGRNRRSVWTVATQPFPGAHFAAFPFKLIEPCILAGCPKGGTVLDPFMGSGTTAMVAYRLGRRWIGVELSETYCQMAVDRIERETAQGKLFA